MFSASTYERLASCTASGFLPHSGETTKHADRGTTVGGFISGVLTGTPIETALEAIDDKDIRETCRHIDFSKLGGDLGNVRCEVAYAIDFRERRAWELGVNIGRNYPKDLGPWVRFGTDDIEGDRPDGCLAGLDVKAGYLPVTPCAENRQQLYYASARMLIRGASEHDSRVAYVRKTGYVHLDPHVFTRLDVDLFLDEGEELIARALEDQKRYLAGGPLAVKTGDWCKFCDAVAHCPEMTRLARALAGELEELDRMTAIPQREMTIEVASEALRRATAAESTIEHIMRRLKTRAHRDWIPTAPGKVFRPVPYETDDFDKGEAVELLRALGASDDQIRALYHFRGSVQMRETNDPRAEKPSRKRKDKAA